ncbi:MAG: hypothetical protein QQW96_01770 [Tychonema bourrellyi B0820]|nr:hypothetical protein [Tychonema bourrellyi B0820]
MDFRLGMGHGAWGMEHGAWGIGHREFVIITNNSQQSTVNSQQSTDYLACLHTFQLAYPSKLVAPIA